VKDSMHDPGNDFAAPVNPGLPHQLAELFSLAGAVLNAYVAGRHRARLQNPRTHTDPGACRRRTRRMTDGASASPWRPRHTSECGSLTAGTGLAS
jgi:hypothetical protein